MGLFIALNFLPILNLSVWVRNKQPSSHWGARKKIAQRYLRWRRRLAFRLAAAIKLGVRVLPHPTLAWLSSVMPIMFVSPATVRIGWRHLRPYVSLTDERPKNFKYALYTAKYVSWSSPGQESSRRSTCCRRHFLLLVSVPYWPVLTGSIPPAS